MKLWRLDAMHEAEEGAFCLFFREEAAAREKEWTLGRVGWMTDVYPEDLGHQVDPRKAGWVVNQIWPNVTTAEVLRLLAGTKEETRV